MPFCVNCGAELSEEQIRNSKQLCYNCMGAPAKRTEGGIIICFGVILLIIDIPIFFLGILAITAGAFSYIPGDYWILSIILLVISILSLYFGIKRRRKYKPK